MSINQLAIPIVAKSIGKKMSVKVKFGHEQPATDGETIFLPDLPLNDEVTRALGLGFVVHESGHIRFTDFDTDLPISPLHKHLRNIFEDVRMELKVTSVYPGAKNVLCDLVDILVGKGFFQAGNNDETPAQVLSRYLLYSLRTSVLGQTSLSPLAKASGDDLESKVSEGAMTRIYSVMSRVATSSSTQEVHDLALEVIGILEDDVKPPEENNEQDSGENDSKSQSEKGEQSPTDDGNDESTGTQENTQQDVPAAPDKKAVQEMLDATDDQVDTDVFESIVADQLDKAVNKAVQRGEVTCGDGIADAAPLPLGDHAQVYADAYQQTYALRTRLQSFMQASKRVNRGTSQSGIKLHDKKLSRVKIGNRSIYRTKQTKKTINTVVQILMDRSISMEHMMDLAMNATLAVASALETIPGVRVAAAAFPGRNADVEPLTQFGEGVKQTAARYPAIIASGGTPLLPALMWATRQLLECKEERKLLLIVTDGEPSNRSACKDMMSQMKANQFETMGLGIMVESISDLCEISTCISNKEELASSMFSMLQENLLKQAY